MIENVCDLACEILQRTDDGNRLAPEDLRLVELAVNGFLKKEGEEQFRELHRNATKPEGYTVPWFLGIENMTWDHERFIYWRGERVEHFDHNVWKQPGWRERMQADAEKLAACCRALEEQAIVPNMKTVSEW